ncbi:MAG: hypothetical protein ACLPQS_00810 [Acidimicrobiales bacterium]
MPDTWARTLRFQLIGMCTATALVTLVFFYQFGLATHPRHVGHGLLVAGIALVMLSLYDAGMYRVLKRAHIRRAGGSDQQGPGVGRA